MIGRKEERKYLLSLLEEHSTLITTYGVGESAYAGELQSIVTAEDLFAN